MNSQTLRTGDGKLTMFLMTEKGLELLKAVHQRFGSIIGCVVVGSDASLQNDHADDIIALCQSVGLPWVRRADHSHVTTEYALAISWRWLIRHPTNKLVVFHDSLLPRYRGFAPLINALINGEPEVGVTAIFGADDFDTGDVIAQSSVKISYPITIRTAIGKVNQCYLDCAETVLGRLAAGQGLTASPQDENLATYSIWRDEADYAIDWSLSAAEIRRLIDAVGFPYKGASARMDGQPVRILAAEEVADVHVENRHCGKVLFVKQGQPVVICGSGLLRITDAVFETPNGDEVLLPMKKFRVRFT